MFPSPPENSGVGLPNEKLGGFTTTVVLAMASAFSSRSCGVSSASASSPPPVAVSIAESTTVPLGRGGGVAAIDKGSNEGHGHHFCRNGVAHRRRNLAFVEGPPTAFTIHWGGQNERIEGETFEANILNFVGR